MMKASPLSSFSASNSYSEHKLLFNDEHTSDSITPLFSDDTDLGLDNNTIDKTSVAGEHAEDNANDDKGLTTFGDFEQDADDVAPVYVGVPQRNIIPINDTLTTEVQFFHLMENTQIAHERSDTYMGLGSQISNLHSINYKSISL